MRLRSLTPTLALALAAACAGNAAGTSASTADATPTRRTSNLITAEEIHGVDVASTAYDLVQRLRPNFLRARGTDPQTKRQEFAKVYVNGMRYGELASLRQITAGNIREIRFLIGPEATMRFGIGHEGGVILVALK